MCYITCGQPPTVEVARNLEKNRAGRPTFPNSDDITCLLSTESSVISMVEVRGGKGMCSLVAQQGRRQVRKKVKTVTNQTSNG